MAIFNGNQAAFTPSLTQNYVLFANDANDYAMVKSVWWGGKPMPHCRVARAGCDPRRRGLAR